MKIVMFGDSITDMGHRGDIGSVHSYGDGYPFVVFSKLSEQYPMKYDIINNGISGNRTVDLYARIKKDVWNLVVVATSFSKQKFIIIFCNKNVSI